MSLTLTTSSNASIPVSCALWTIISSAGRDVDTAAWIRVIGSSPKGADLLVVSGKCNASKMDRNVGSLVAANVKDGNVQATMPDNVQVSVQIKQQLPSGTTIATASARANFILPGDGRPTALAESSMGRANYHVAQRNRSG